MWFDTHCHLDAPEFAADLSLVIARAAEQGVTGILIPAVQVKDFERVVQIVDTWQIVMPRLCFTLGVHPLFTKDAAEGDVALPVWPLKNTATIPDWLVWARLVLIILSTF